MKKPFEVGERVVGYLCGMRIVGTILKINQNGTCNFEGYNWSPEQLRRLVKKKRREIWIAEWHNGSLNTYWYNSKELCENTHRLNTDFKRAVHFIEVKE
jgi:hypothetical protein